MNETLEATRVTDDAEAYYKPIANLARQLARAEFFGDHELHETVTDELIGRMAKAETDYAEAGDPISSDSIFHYVTAVNEEELQKLNDGLFANQKPVKYTAAESGEVTVGVLYDTPGTVIAPYISEYMQHEGSCAIIRGIKDGKSVEWLLQPDAVYDIDYYKAGGYRRIGFDKDEDAPAFVLGEEYRINADKGSMEMDRVDEVEILAGTDKHYGLSEEDLEDFVDRGKEPYDEAYQLIMDNQPKPQVPTQVVAAGQLKPGRTVVIPETTLRPHIKPRSRKANKSRARNPEAIKSQAPQPEKGRARRVINALKNLKALGMVSSGKGYIASVELIGKSRQNIENIKREPNSARKYGKIALAGLGFAATVLALHSIHRRGGDSVTDAVTKAANSSHKHGQELLNLHMPGLSHDVSKALDHVNDNLQHATHHVKHVHHTMPRTNLVQAAAAHRTGSLKEVTVRSGQNPWTISEQILHRRGIARPSLAQIAAYDEHMAHLNADVYSMTGDSSEHIAVGTKLKYD